VEKLVCMTLNAILAISTLEVAKRERIKGHF